MLLDKRLAQLKGESGVLKVAGEDEAVGIKRVVDRSVPDVKIVDIYVS